MEAIIKKIIDNYRFRWHNINPDPDCPFVVDKKGQKYWLYWDTNYLRLYIFFYDKRIAKCCLIWRSNELEIADICIFPPKLRGRGLGSALIREFIQVAKNRGVQNIILHIQPGDARKPKTVEELIEIYRHLGFQVNEEDRTATMDIE